MSAAALPAPMLLPTERDSKAPSLCDSRGRALHDLRISVTDRCNFRCTYCMPKTVFGRDYPFLPKTSLLSFEEITRVARLMASLGVRKIRLTGGEPLLRHDLEKLIAQLAQIDGLDLALTTNGALLVQRAQSLKAAGLGRITVSLDTLDDLRFQRISDVKLPLRHILDGIQAAQDAGFASIKINMVVKKNENDQDILPMVRYFRHRGISLRFIEFMDVGNSNDWHIDHVLPSAEIVRLVHAAYPLEPVTPAYPGEVAQRWRYRDGAGEIGFVSSVTKAFCGDCTRLRLSTEGMLYTCLFAQTGFDLRQQLRSNQTDAAISQMLTRLWHDRADRYSELRNRNAAVPSKKIEMSYIGG